MYICIFTKMRVRSVCGLRYRIFVNASAIWLPVQDSGTTATVSIVCGMDIVTASSGDSLAFLDCGSGVHQLSGNHRIDDNAAERKRLEDAGGEISQSEVDGVACGPLRIWPGGLAMSR